MKNGKKYIEDLNLHLIKGDLSALKQLYESHWKRVFNVAYGLLKSKEDAEELVQDVFLKLWDYRSDVSPHLPIEGLLFTIAKRETFNRLRKKASNFTFIEVDEYQLWDNYTEHQLAQNELVALSENAIQNLPPKRRHIFNLRLQQGMTNKEIADNLGVSVKFVERQISIARRSLQEQFNVNGFTSFSLLFFILFFS